uniref:G-patch domain and KOW motifs-containing protein-like isoform X2 n=1 Tax=Myxine glutinosa TaxID=7769 RepID=UPI00358FF5A5
MDRSSFAAKHHPWMDLWVNVAPMPYSTKPKELYKELVIPLIKQNRWETLKGKKLLPEQKPNDAEFEAIKEVLEDSRRFLEKQEQRDIHAMDETFAIPMLLQNKVPDGFEDGGKVDVSLRPDVTLVRKTSYITTEDKQAEDTPRGFVIGRGGARRDSLLGGSRPTGRPG